MYAIDLTSFYELVKSKPLLNNHVVKHGDRSYRVERWFKEDKHCYVFVDITMNTTLHKKPFAKKPSDVEALIKSKKLNIITYSP